MAFQFGHILQSILTCTAILVSPEVFAEDCGPGSPNLASATCLPGTYVYQQQQQQQEQQQQFFQQQEQQLQSATAAATAAADPRNQYDPSSPYYGAKQCEAAKHSLYCVLGILCAPANVDCTKFAPKPVARHHNRPNP